MIVEVKQPVWIKEKKIGEVHELEQYSVDSHSLDVPEFKVTLLRFVVCGRMSVFPHTVGF